MERRLQNRARREGMEGAEGVGSDREVRRASEMERNCLQARERGSRRRWWSRKEKMSSQHSRGNSIAGSFSVSADFRWKD